MSYNLGTARGVVEILYNPKGVKKAESDLEGLGKKGESSGKTLQKTGSVMGATGSVVAAGLLVAVNAAANFEESLSGIQAVSGATSKEMEQVRAKALQIGKDTAFGATDASEAMGELIKAGLTTREVLDGAADATVALAAAGGVSLPDAATIASNAMNQFNIAAEDMPKVADLIAGAANASAIDVGEFGRSLAQVGTVAHTVGFTFKDTATAIALLGNAGIKGSDAGTALKTMFINLVPHTKQAQIMFNDLHLATFDVKRGMQVLREEGIKPTGSSMKAVTDQLIKLSAEQSHSKVGSTKQAKAYAELLQTTGVMKNQFFDAKGKVKDLASVFGILQNALKGQTQEQKIATLSTLFGTDAIRGAALATELGKHGFNEMGTAMSKVSAEAVAAQRLNNVKGDIEKLKGSAETLAINMGTLLLPSIRNLVSGFDGLLGKLNEMNPATRQNVVTYAVWAAGILLAMAAVTRIIGVVGSFIGIIGRVGSAMRLGALANLLWNSSLITTLRLQALYAAGWVRATAAAVANRVATLATAAAARVAGAAQAIWAAATNALSLANIRAAATTVATTAAQLASRAAMIAGAVATGIMTAAQWALNVAMSLNPIGIVIIAIIALVAAIVIAYKKSATFRAIVQAVFGAISRFIGAAFNFIRQVISSVINWAVGFFQSRLAVARAVWSAVFGFISSFVSSRIAIARAVISAGMAFIQNRIAAIRAVISIVSGIFNSVVGAIRSKVSGAISAAASIVSGIVGRIRGLGSSLVSAGRDAIQGLLNGISSMAGAVIDKARSIANSVTSAIKGALHIGSPSRITMELGEFTGEGYAIGLENMLRRVRQAANSMAAVPVAAITSPVASVSGAGAPTSPAGGFGPAVVFEKGAIPITALPGMNEEQLGTHVARKLSTAVSTRTSAPRIRPGAA